MSELNHHEATITFERDAMTKGEVWAVAGLVSAALGAIGWFAWADWKDQKEEELARGERDAERRRFRLEEEAWFDQQRREGRIPLRLATGDTISIPADAYRDAEVRPTQPRVS